MQVIVGLDGMDARSYQFVGYGEKMGGACG
jgi:hypothetical protein